MSTVFQIRNTMKEPKKLPSVTVCAFLILGVIFLILPLSTYMVYGDQAPTSSFYCYTWEYMPFFFVLQAIFIVGLAPFMPFFIISVFEPLEFFDAYKKCISLSDGTISRARVVIIRSIGTIVVVALCMITNDVNEITELTGNLFNSLLSFMTPIFLVHAKAYWINKKRKSVGRIIHDSIIFVFSISMMVYGTYNQVHGWFTVEKNRTL